MIRISNFVGEDFCMMSKPGQASQRILKEFGPSRIQPLGSAANTPHSHLCLSAHTVLCFVLIHRSPTIYLSDLLPTFLSNKSI